MLRTLLISAAFLVALAGRVCVGGGNTTLATPQPTPVNNSTPQIGLFKASLPQGFIEPTDPVGQRLLRDYGALFVARGVTVPRTVIFKDDKEVTDFQTSAASAKAVVGGIAVELQPAALKALQDAIAEAARSSLKITPRGGDSAKRTYEHTVTLWASRVNPGLTHWVAAGKITAADAKRIKALSPFDQVPEILALEDKGIWFSKDLSKSIVYSVAPPGTSQHLTMLALDIAQFDDARVRAIMANHGWFQTVTSDLPHFTYLGAEESELPKLGLKKITNANRDFWVPDI
ncbi:MAG: hypothetical protein JO314_04970 [Acidobacteria bacterium]|nr:hypothetical protein [Acidobacteriota bacterium]